jgi:hypothetical protein
MASEMTCGEGQQHRRAALAENTHRDEQVVERDVAAERTRTLAANAVKPAAGTRAREGALAELDV